MSVWTTRVQIDTGDMKILSDVYICMVMCVYVLEKPQGLNSHRGREGQWLVISTGVSGVQGCATHLSQMTDVFILSSSICRPWY